MVLNQKKSSFATQKLMPMLLIIDDDSGVRSSLSFMLKRAGYQVIAVTGPREAMEVVRSEAPSLILMDMEFYTFHFR